MRKNKRDKVKRHSIRSLTRRAAALLTALVVVLGAGVPASAAAELPDTSRTGSISLTMKYQNKAVAGGSFSLYQVAGVTVSDTGYGYTLVNGFEDCGVSLDNLEDSKLASQLEAKVDSAKSKVTSTVSSSGTVKFEDLELGLYLIVQETAAEGYNKVSSFIVTVPIDEDGALTYDVDATPKMSAITAVTPTPKKPATPKTTPKVLPKTGQLNWPVPVLVVSGLLVFAFGWSLRRGKSAHEA